MVKDIMRANETATLNQKELEVLNEYFPTCFHSDGSFDLMRFSEFLNNKVNVTKEGYEWGRQSKDEGATEVGYDETTMFNGCSVVFSDKFMGSFLVPSENSWNYNFHGIQFSSSMSYDMISDIPREYYDPVRINRLNIISRFIVLNILEISVILNKLNNQMLIVIMY